MAEGGHGAVAGDERGVVAHRPKPGGDRADQLLLIAVRKIPAAARALEQHVAHQRALRFRVVEDDVGGGVAGAMADVEGELADWDLVAVGEPARWLERT